MNLLKVVFERMVLNTHENYVDQEEYRNCNCTQSWGGRECGKASHLLLFHNRWHGQVSENESLKFGGECRAKRRRTVQMSKDIVKGAEKDYQPPEPDICIAIKRIHRQ